MEKIQMWERFFLLSVSDVMLQLEYNGVPDVQNYNSSKCYESWEGGNVQKQTRLFQREDSDELAKTNLFYQNNTAQQEQQVEPFSGYGRFNELYYDTDPSPFQLDQEERAKLRNIHYEILELFPPEEEKSCTSSLLSFGILNCRSNFGQHNSVKVNVPGSDIACSKVGDRSINEIIRLGGEKFIQSSSPRVDDLSDLSHPLSTSFFGLSDEETRDVEVIQNLLASAEKVGEQHFDSASKLLNLCHEFSSDKGSPVQRLVYYFSAALRERINQEMGIEASNMNKSLEFDEPMINPDMILLTFFEQVPFCRVMQFAAMQAIIENVAQAKKIHIIDLEIKNGTHCSIFIQALASRHACPVEHLKITAIGTKSQTQIEETGTRLINFAESMNLSLSFNVVMVADMLDLNENLFELDPNEVVAVYAPYFLSTMIGKQDRIECLMRVIRNINPCVMVVAEIEANHNSPVFVNRFIEALFFFGAFFDCLVDCMDPDDPHRFITESIYFGQGIRNIVAAEGKERTIRQVKNNVWMVFFSQFDMVQKELSMSSLYQASLVAKNFDCETSCSLNTDGNSLIIGWKGTPVLSLSAWKFL